LTTSSGKRRVNLAVSFEGGNIALSNLTVNGKKYKIKAFEENEEGDIVFITCVKTSGKKKHLKLQMAPQSKWYKANSCRFCWREKNEVQISSLRKNGIHYCPPLFVCHDLTDRCVDHGICGALNCTYRIHEKGTDMHPHKRKECERVIALEVYARKISRLKKDLTVAELTVERKRQKMNALLENGAFPGLKKRNETSNDTYGVEVVEGDYLQSVEDEYVGS
jgi:hypothetical protein